MVMAGRLYFSVSFSYLTVISLWRTAWSHEIETSERSTVTRRLRAQLCFEYDGEQCDGPALTGGTAGACLSLSVALCVRFCLPLIF